MAYDQTCTSKQIVIVNLPGLGLGHSSNILKVWGSTKLLSMEGKGITPVEIDTLEGALSSCSDIVDAKIWIRQIRVREVWRHRPL